MSVLFLPKYQSQSYDWSIRRNIPSRYFGAKLYIKHKCFIGVGVGLVAAEDVAGVNFVFHVVEHGIEAVGNDGFAQLLELGEVVHHQ